jgi:hypothetical protein
VCSLDEIPDDDRDGDDQQPHEQIDDEKMVADLSALTRAGQQVLPNHLVAKS